MKVGDVVVFSKKEKETLQVRINNVFFDSDETCEIYKRCIDSSFTVVQVIGGGCKVVEGVLDNDTFNDVLYFLDRKEQERINTFSKFSEESYVVDPHRSIEITREVNKLFKYWDSYIQNYIFERGYGEVLFEKVSDFDIIK